MNEKGASAIVAKNENLGVVYQTDHHDFNTFVCFYWTLETACESCFGKCIPGGSPDLKGWKMRLNNGSRDATYTLEEILRELAKELTGALKETNTIVSAAKVQLDRLDIIGDPDIAQKVHRTDGAVYLLIFCPYCYDSLRRRNQNNGTGDINTFAHMIFRYAVSVSEAGPKDKTFPELEQKCEEVNKRSVLESPPFNEPLKEWRIAKDMLEELRKVARVAVFKEFRGTRTCQNCSYME